MILKAGSYAKSGPPGENTDHTPLINLSVAYGVLFELANQSMSLSDSEAVTTTKYGCPPARFRPDTLMDWRPVKGLYPVRVGG